MGVVSRSDSFVLIEGSWFISLRLLRDQYLRLLVLRILSTLLGFRLLCLRGLVRLRLCKGQDYNRGALRAFQENGVALGLDPFVVLIREEFSLGTCVV